jgi:hypothetical protein
MSKAGQFVFQGKQLANDLVSTPEKETSSPRQKEETMERTIGSKEKYCDTGAASGQSDCGQTTGESCKMDAASGQCGFSSSRIAGESGYCGTGAASGQSACGQTTCDCDDGYCC